MEESLKDSEVLILVLHLKKYIKEQGEKGTPLKFYALERNLYCKFSKIHNDMVEKKLAEIKLKW